MYQQVIELTLKAGRVIMQFYQGQLALQTQHKEDNSPVTSADLAAHQIILDGLRQLTPDIPVISEEAPPCWNVRQHWQNYWLIDPLDGTREFLNRSGDFTVNIALINQGKPIFGVIYVPVRQTLYCALAGQAWKQQGEQHETLRVRTAYPPVILVSRCYHDAQLDAWLRQQGTHHRQEVGSSLKFCLLAEGLAQLYPRFGSTHIWDTAAGQAIAQTAGAQVLDWQGNPLNYHPRESLLNPGFRVLIPDK